MCPSMMWSMTNSKGCDMEEQLLLPADCAGSGGRVVRPHQSRPVIFMFSGQEALATQLLWLPCQRGPLACRDLAGVTTGPHDSGSYVQTQHRQWVTSPQRHLLPTSLTEVPMTGSCCGQALKPSGNLAQVLPSLCVCYGSPVPSSLLPGSVRVPQSSLLSFHCLYLGLFSTFMIWSWR